MDEVAEADFALGFIASACFAPKFYDEGIYLTHGWQLSMERAANARGESTEGPGLTPVERKEVDISC